MWLLNAYLRKLLYSGHQQILDYDYPPAVTAFEPPQIISR